MPELPEVECLRRSLARIVGRRVVRAELFRLDVTSWIGDANDGAAWTGLPPGNEIFALHRRGKQLAIETRGGGVLVIHLGMSGQTLLDSTRVERTHTHACWTLDDGSTLSFRDPRRFGGLWAGRDIQAVENVLWKGLGADALNVTATMIQSVTRASKRAIKSILLDQRVVAGIGNIYADEALFDAGIRPTSRRTLSDTLANRLAASIRSTLNAAITRGGSTLRDYVDASGSAGSAQHLHRVYGRGGECCVSCGGVLRQISFLQRTTVFCPRCQPA
ncbi:MAG: bifunctional DNA-formamidopyrimidine glycosylase/DNA-(apurinic or apyrimidinic site) lyase [Planctomycetota bacterium]